MSLTCYKDKNVRPYHCFHLSFKKMAMKQKNNPVKAPGSVFLPTAEPLVVHPWHASDVKTHVGEKSRLQ